MVMNLIKIFWRKIKDRFFLTEKQRIRKQIQERWKSLGFTEGLEVDIKENVGKLYECECKSKKKQKKNKMLRG
jgi:hypothetical protein